jgi:hypothetical protein
MHLSFFIFFMLHDYYLLVVKLMLHAPLAPKFEGVLVTLNLNAFSVALSP